MWTDLGSVKYRVTPFIENEHVYIIDFNSTIRDTCEECDLIERCDKCEEKTKYFLNLKGNLLFISDDYELLNAYLEDLERKDNVSAIVGKNGYYKPFIKNWQLYKYLVNITNDVNLALQGLPANISSINTVTPTLVVSDNSTNFKLIDTIIQDDNYIWNIFCNQEQIPNPLFSNLNSNQDIKAATRTIAFVQEPCFVMMIGRSNSGRSYAANKLKSMKNSFIIECGTTPLTEIMQNKQSVITRIDSLESDTRVRMAKMAQSYKYNSIVFWYLQTPDAIREHLKCSKIQMFDEYEKEQKNFDEPTEEEAKRANALLIKTQFVLGPAPIEVSHFRYT